MSTEVLSALNEVKREDVRDYIMDIQDRMAEVPGMIKGDNPVCPLKHTFVNGIYTREIFIPKGMMIVGKIHKHAHPNFLMSGDVSVLTEEGARRIQGPKALVSPAGTKRLLYTHEATVWVTVHANPDNKDDLEPLEDEIIAKTYEEFDALPKHEFFKCITNKES